MYRYLKRVSSVGSGSYIFVWASKELSDENITASATSDFKLNPQVSYFGTKTRVEFSGTCLKQGKVIYDHGKKINIYIVYDINKSFNISNYSTVENCLFGAVSFTKNADIDKYKYWGYGLGFDRHGVSSHPSGGTGRNVIILRVDMTSSTKIDNRKKYILIIGKSPTQGFEHTLSAEKCIQLILQSITKVLFELAL